MWWNECLMKKENLKMYNHHCIAADFGIKTTEGPLESKYVLIYCFFYSGWPSPTEVVTPNVSVTFSQRRPKKSISPIFCFYFYLIQSLPNHLHERCRDTMSEPSCSWRMCLLMESNKREKKLYNINSWGRLREGVKTKILQSTKLKTHFISLCGVSKMHF